MNHLKGIDHGIDHSIDHEDLIKKFNLIGSRDKSMNLKIVSPLSRKKNEMHYQGYTILVAFPRAQSMYIGIHVLNGMRIARCSE